MRGRNTLHRCFYCGRTVPIDKMVRFVKYGFSYHDERMGIHHQGMPQTQYCCLKCGRHFHIQDKRPRFGMPKKR